MSFNDLERSVPSPSPAEAREGVAAAGISGQHYNRGSQRSTRSGAAGPRGPLPLYHAPRSSNDASPGQHGDASSPTMTDPAFKQLADRIGIQIFKLNSNVQGIDKLVELQLRAMRTTSVQQQLSPVPTTQARQTADKDWTGQIHDLIETTRALVKDLSDSIKSLAAYQLHQLTSTDRLTTGKIQREFEAAINAFARAQRESAKLSRTMLDGAKEVREKTIKAASTTGDGSLSTTTSRTAVDDTLMQANDAGSDDEMMQQQQQQQQRRNEPSQAEIEFQETLIAERESEIREIENGIQELNEIFRDLGHIVQEQGGMIDNIEYNVQTITANTGAADRELVSASDYQRRAGRRAACLLLIVGFVVAVVLLAILS